MPTPDRSATAEPDKKLSRKQKKRLRSAARRKNKQDAIRQKHISSHKFVTFESMAPTGDDESSFMRKRLKRQKRRMEEQNDLTVLMFKVNNFVKCMCTIFIRLHNSETWSLWLCDIDFL